MVLEARDHARPVAEVGLDRAVADQPRARLAHGAQVDQPDAGQLLAAELVGVAEQLVAAADGEHDRAAVGRGVEGVALGGDHVVRDGDLVAVLAAAHVEEVVGVRVERLAEARRGVLEAEAAPLAAGAQHRDVAAVGVDVHQLGVERADPQRRHTTTMLPMYASVVGAPRAAPTGRRPWAGCLALELRPAVSESSICVWRSSVELPAGDTIWRSHSTATPPGSGRTSSGRLE